MPWFSQDYLRSLGPSARAELYRTHLCLGYHPETDDELLVPNVDRFSSMNVLGVPGGGKSGLLQNLIHADMMTGHAVIVLDPHADLIMGSLNAVPDHRVSNTFLLDLTDEDFPYGVNVFPTTKLTGSIERSRAVERIMHIFEVVWPEIVNQQYIQLFLPNVVRVFLDNQNKTLVDMLQFLQNDAFRASMLQNVSDPMIRDFWEQEYNQQSELERRRRVQPLTNRLHTLFTGNPLVRNLLGQPRTTINWRKAIETKQIIFIKLPVKDIPHVASLVGAILVSQIHAAVFSFADTPPEKRSGVSLYIDEVQNFASSNFASLISEGRKFSLRLTIAHQHRAQLPGFLREPTTSARTKVCFQLTPDDGREMAHFFPSSEATIRPENIEPHVSHYLLTYGIDDPVARTFIETYLRGLQGKKRGNRMEIDVRDLAPSVFEVVNGERFDNPRVPDPTWYLDSLLHQVMRERNASLPIPPEVVLGFSGCGSVFFKQVAGISPKDISLSSRVCFPRALVVPMQGGGLQWTRRPEGGTEQFFHFIFHLRALMHFLAQNPLGKATTTPATAVAQMLTSLPRRAAFVRTGETVGVIYTSDTPEPLPPQLFKQRLEAIVQHTRTEYCRPRAEVEQEMLNPTPPPNLPHPSQPPQVPPTRWEETS